MYIKKALPAYLLTLICASGAYANTADLRVTGIIVPGSCVPHFSNGGVVDHGNIAIPTLNPTSNTSLPRLTFDYNVACDAPIRIGMTWRDNRAGSASTANVKNFGLGKQGSVNLGYYTLTNASATADGSQAAIISSLNNAAFVAGGANNNDGSTRISFSNIGSVVPKTATNFAGSIAVNSYLVRSDSLDLTDKVILDGAATMELKYF